MAYMCLIIYTITRSQWRAYLAGAGPVVIALTGLPGRSAVHGHRAHAVGMPWLVELWLIIVFNNYG